MTISLRLRRALAAAPLLRASAAASAFSSPSRPFLPFLPRSSAPPPLLPPRPPHHHPLFFLPGAAAGFRSTAAAAARGGVDYGDDKISPDEILFEGCDFNHWLITMEFPDPKPSREEMIETYLQTIAKVVGSYEEAKKRMYAFSTTTYVGFQVIVTEEMSEKFRGLPGVVFILPDSYLYPDVKEYGGDQYDNGVITPRPPPVTYSRPSRTDRNRNYRGNYQDGPPPQGNYQNGPPQQGNYRNSPPQQGNFQNSPPQQGNFQNNPPRQGNFQTYPSQQDGRGYAPQQNYAQAGQDDRGYARNDNADRSGYNRPPGGYQSEATQYQGHANPAVQGQGFYNPQERRNIPQGQAGDFKPGGPSAPGYGQPSATGTYGQPPASGNFGQPPASTYPGSNQGGPGVNPGLQGTGPANGGDNWQGGSGQYPSRGEGQQGNWQGRQ